MGGFDLESEGADRQGSGTNILSPDSNRRGCLGRLEKTTGGVSPLRGAVETGREGVKMASEKIELTLRIIRTDCLPHREAVTTWIFSNFEELRDSLKIMPVDKDYPDAVSYKVAKDYFEKADKQDLFSAFCEGRVSLRPADDPSEFPQDIVSWIFPFRARFEDTRDALIKRIAQQVYLAVDAYEQGVGIDLDKLE